ncbi:uncharacterized protein BJ171DRAFT_564870 [Polychytrium aggregatum]|uniref:uncharacterized protein n=1 Tax=Polychytrium aggregatum TaxID=110093 RepID=UPI0022FE830E|nr:uncharacterized protein BJ171DRAFT_564870 [Polychytrium aggregatum]KAI9209035.1 hypothetical protein BJ171DRAFT_564870 [Polychytrium aggregatum]
MSGLKQYLKAAREAIDKKDFALAKDNAKWALDIDQASYNAHIFLGLAEQNLGNVKAAEASFRNAADLNPDGPLAFQGLASLFEKTGDQEGWIANMKSLLDLHHRGSDGKKCQDAIEKMVEYAKKRDDRKLIMSTLAYLLPESEYYAKLPSPPDVLETLEALIAYQEADDSVTTAREIELRRRRLGAGTFQEVREAVERDVMTASQLEYLYGRLIAETTQRGLEASMFQGKLLDYLQRKIIYVNQDEKEAIREQLFAIARELVSAGRTEPLALAFLLESQDCEIEDYDGQLVAQASELDGHYIQRACSAYAKWIRNEDGVDEALEDALEALSRNSKSILANHLLSYIYLERGEFLSSADTVMKTRSLVELQEAVLSTELSNVRLSLDLCVAKAYLNMDLKYLPNAQTTYASVLERRPDDHRALEGLGLVLSKLKKWDEAKACFERVIVLNPESDLGYGSIGWIYYQAEKYQDALDYLNKALQMNEAALYHYRIGQVYWKMAATTENTAQVKVAYQHLMTAAKLDPNLSAVFTSLGHYYMDVEGDSVRAQKCFLRAINLDISEEDAASRLVDIYLQANSLEDAFDLLQVCTNANPRALWAWKRLGIYHLVAKSFQEAIFCFQAALRIDPRDLLCWESLAEAYSEEGKFMAALKAFSRTLELNPESALSYYHIGIIKQKLKLYPEAVEAFKQAISLLAGHHHVPSIKGVCESLLSQAREYHATGAYGRVIDALNEALKTMTACVQHLSAQGTGFASLFSLLGDICLSFRHLSLPEYVDRIDRQELESCLAYLAGQKPDERLGLVLDPGLHITTGDAIEQALRCGELAFKCATVAYCQSTVGQDADRNKILSGYWYSIGLSYFYRQQQEHKAAAKATLLEAAVKFTKAALALDDSSDLYWNALGTYVMQSNPALAQHAFIMAVEHNSKNAASWCNLGLLYLIHGDYTLASSCFSSAQLQDPDWPVSWFGQACVAEKLGQTNAYTLLEHAYDLGQGSVPEINYLFGLRFYKRAIENGERNVDLYASAAFCLLKFTERSSSDPVVLNLYGLVLERQGKYMAALEAFDTALEALEHASQKDKTRLASVTENKARVLCALGLFEDSVGCWELCLQYGGSADGFTHVGQGLALYFAKRLPESLMAFEKAVKVAASRETVQGSGLIRNDIALMLSQVLYALGSPQHLQLAKGQLLECVKRNNRSLKAMLSLCAMGLVKDDLALAKSAAVEIMKVRPDEAGADDHDIEWVLSRMFLIQGNTKVAKGFLAKAIHRYPHRAERWARLCELQFRSEPLRPEVYLSLGQSALSLVWTSRADIQSSTELSSDVHLTHGLGLLASGASVSAQRKAIQKAIHCRPHDSKSWLALSLHLRAEASIGAALDGNIKQGKSEPTGNIQQASDRFQRLASVATFTQASAQRAAPQHPASSAITYYWAMLIEADARVQHMAHITRRINVDTLAKSNKLVETVLSKVGATPQTASAKAILVDALRVQADIHIASGNIGNGLACLKKAVSLAPKWTAGWVALGKHYEAVQRVEAATTCFKQALQTATSGPSKIPILLRLVRCALLSGALDFAKDAASDILKQDASCVAARMLQGLVYAKTGAVDQVAKLVKALNGIVEKTELDGGSVDPWVFLTLAQVADEQGDLTTVESMTERARNATDRQLKGV